MSTLADALGHPRNGCLNAGQCQKIQTDAIAHTLPTLDMPQVTQAGQGGFERKALCTLHAGRYLIEHQTSGPDGDRFRCKRRQAGCNQVRIDETRAMRFLR